MSVDLYFDPFINQDTSTNTLYDVPRCAVCGYGYAQSMYVFISCVGDGVMKYSIMRVLTARRHQVEVIACTVRMPLLTVRNTTLEVHQMMTCRLHKSLVRRGLANAIVSLYVEENTYCIVD